MMTVSLLVIGIILSVIASLTTLILGIVHIATGKNRSALILGVSFIMSLIIFILCIMEVVKRGSNKVKQGIEWVKKQKYENTNNINWSYNEDERDSTGYSDSLATLARDSAIARHSPSRMEEKRKRK